MKYIKEIIRVLFGAVFVFSGFVKGVDPMGSTYKFTDYFVAMDLAWAVPFSLVLGILLALAEFGIGIGLLLNYRVKLLSWLGLIFMAFFLPTTLWVALKNPVTDCGCFGDALVISNWATFYKNLVLMAMAIFIVLFRKQYNNKFNIHFQNAYFDFALIFFFFIQIYSYRYEPIIDFRPYKIGKNITEGMTIPEGAPRDSTRNVFVYKNLKTGKEQKFSDADYPWQDTLNWKFVSMDIKVIKKGYTPPIHDFTIENNNGENVADFFLSDTSYTFLLIAHDLDKASTKKQAEINNFAQQAKDNGMNFICLTASASEKTDAFKQKHNTPYDFFFCDEITLKTIIRSNPGLVMLKKGTVVNKWPWRHFPEFDNVKK